MILIQKDIDELQGKKDEIHARMLDVMREDDDGDEGGSTQQRPWRRRYGDQQAHPPPPADRRVTHVFLIMLCHAIVRRIVGVVSFFIIQTICFRFPKKNYMFCLLVIFNGLHVAAFTL